MHRLSQPIHASNGLLLYNGPFLFYVLRGLLPGTQFLYSDPKPGPQAIQHPRAVRTCKDERAGVEEVRVARAVGEPEVVEEWKEERSVYVQKGCHDGVAEVC